MQPQYAPAGNVHSQEWQNGLMSCGPCDLCLLGTCLPCIRKSSSPRLPALFVTPTLRRSKHLHGGTTIDLGSLLVVGKTSERMRDPTMRTYEPFNSDCLLMCGITYFTGCGWM